MSDQASVAAPSVSTATALLLIPLTWRGVTAQPDGVVCVAFCNSVGATGDTSESCPSADPSKIGRHRRQGGVGLAT